ncbi:hypothetical protein OH799_33145 [Nocardia sp. NBC_00881]|uniref:hypothetical protein n=1 Tax=Nocardia sp. NBC_00881 TaxID=2975995 RepID=UPI00386613D4|nr:hypothetical protein OH799_33145 [Nocardia sp. NBC_00881]
MGTKPPGPSVHPFYRRAASLVVAGVIPLSVAVAGAATAAADPLSPDSTIQIPFGRVPAIATVPAADPADPGSVPGDAVIPADPGPVPGDVPPAPPPIPPIPPVTPESPVPPEHPASTGRNDMSTTRPMPDPGKLAPIDPQRLRFPNPLAPAPPVALIEAPEGTLRVGSLIIGRPEWLSREQGKQFNDAIAGSEAGMAQSLDSAGFEPSRSDRIAADVIGATTIGASVGSIVAAPVASIGAGIGAVCGAIAGIPMFPTGTVATTVFGAAVGYAFVASPAIAIGAAVGAAVGVAEGLLMPPTIPAS